MADLGELNRCRLCFSSNNLTDAIFPADGSPNEELIQKIYACTSIRICFERDFPCPVCSSCVRILNQFHAYRRKCVNNDRELRRIRGENNGKSDDEEQEQGEQDPLGCFSNSTAKKQEKGNQQNSDQKFYGHVKKRIHIFLESKVREIEREAMARVDKALKHRRSAVKDEDLQMAVEDLYGDEHLESIDTSQTNGSVSSEDDECDPDEKTENWKKKYLILQQNNDHLQKAFREQKIKMKCTEKTLKSYQQQAITPKLKINSPRSITNVEWPSSSEPFDKWSCGGFKVHPALPEITVEFLEDLSYNSGPGEKGDRNFVSKLAVAVFGAETMAFSSVTGRPSNAHHNIPAKPPLCPQKIAAIGLKLFERVHLELGNSNQEELLARSNDKLVRLIVCQKSMNLRKTFAKQSQQIINGIKCEVGVASANFDADDDEGEPPLRKRKSYC